MKTYRIVFYWRDVRQVCGAYVGSRYHAVPQSKRRGTGRRSVSTGGRMSEQLYRVCYRYEGETEIVYSNPMSKEAADFCSIRGNQSWGRMIVHWVEPVPPSYEPPAIVAEDDLTTAAGSPCMGGDDDLLGVKPPC